MNWIKGRVLGAKTVTQLNSVRVSFVNRKENRGSLAKAPAHARVQPLCARAREWAEPRVAVHAGQIGFPNFQ